MYSIIENVISQWDSGLYSARGVKFVVNFFLVLGSIEINPISRGTLKHSLPLIFCAFYVECWFPLKFFTPLPIVSCFYCSIFPLYFWQRVFKQANTTLHQLTTQTNTFKQVVKITLSPSISNTAALYTSPQHKLTQPYTSPHRKQTNPKTGTSKQQFESFSS